MIEPADEMRMVAYRDAREWAAAHGHQQPDDRMINDVLTAVLAIVERDYDVRHRSAAMPPCGAPGPDGLLCAFNPHGRGYHAALTTSGEVVRW